MTATEGLVPSSGWRCRSSRYTCAAHAVGGHTVSKAHRATMRPNDRAHLRQLAAGHSCGSEADMQPEVPALWAAGSQRQAIATRKHHASARQCQPVRAPGQHCHPVRTCSTISASRSLTSELLPSGTVSCKAAARARSPPGCYEEEAAKRKIMLQHTALPALVVCARAAAATPLGAWSGTAYLLPGPRNRLRVNNAIFGQAPSRKQTANVQAKIKSSAPCP